MSEAARIFVAGATGAIGRTLMGLPHHSELIPHVRPETHARGTTYPGAALLELHDREALTRALAGVGAVLQLIGTMRRRFELGDTYETSDIGTTKFLADAAVDAGVEHFIILSSVGAGRPLGAYLRAKAKAESIVAKSGLPYTIFRPSAFEGAGHAPPPGMRALTGALHLDRYRPIRVEALALALLQVAETGTYKGEILEGAALWAVVEEAQRARPLP